MLVSLHTIIEQLAFAMLLIYVRQETYPEIALIHRLLRIRSSSLFKQALQLTYKLKLTYRLTLRFLPGNLLVQSGQTSSKRTANSRQCHPTNVIPVTFTRQSYTLVFLASFSQFFVPMAAKKVPPHWHSIGLLLLLQLKK